MNRGPFEFSAEPVKETAPQSDALSRYRSDFGALAGTMNSGEPLKTPLVANITGPSSPAILNGRYSTSDRWAAEGKLLASIPSHLGEGIVESAKDAWEHKGRTSFEIVSGVALGAAFTLLSRNPRPIVAAATNWTGRAFMAVAGVDLAGRFARPMSSTWADPDNLERDKTVLGHNIGDAVVNYGLAVGGGIAGAKIGEKYIATTKLGTIMQGYKETEVAAEVLAKAASEPAAVNEPLGVMARAFDRSATTSEFPLKGSVRMREMPDGSHIGSTADGNVMVLTSDGTAMFFKNTRTGLFKEKLDLNKIFHKGGDETDVLTGIYSPTTSGSFGLKRSAGNTQFVGKDPSAYFDSPTGVAGNTAHSAKFAADEAGRLRTVETAGNKVFTDHKGNWKLSLGEGKTFDFLNLSPVAFNLGGLIDRYRAMKKGAEVGLSESVLARMGDIGTGVFEHEILIRSGGGAAVQEADENAHKSSI